MGIIGIQMLAGVGMGQNFREADRVVVGFSGQQAFEIVRAALNSSRKAGFGVEPASEGLGLSEA